MPLPPRGWGIEFPSSLRGLLSQPIARNARRRLLDSAPTGTRVAWRRRWSATASPPRAVTDPRRGDTRIESAAQLDADALPGAEETSDVELEVAH